MKIYSEKTNKEYKSVEECLEAEKAFDEAEAKRKAEEEAKQKALAVKREAANAERKAAAEDVEAKRKAAVEAQKEYREALSKFCSKYGAYHYSIKSDGDSIFNILSGFWDFPW